MAHKQVVEEVQKTMNLALDQSTMTILPVVHSANHIAIHYISTIPWSTYPKSGQDCDAKQIQIAQVQQLRDIAEQHYATKRSALSSSTPSQQQIEQDYLSEQMRLQEQHAGLLKRQLEVQQQLESFVQARILATTEEMQQGKKLPMVIAEIVPPKVKDDVKAVKVKEVKIKEIAAVKANEVATVQVKEVDASKPEVGDKPMESKSISAPPRLASQIVAATQILPRVVTKAELPVKKINDKSKAPTEEEVKEFAFRSSMCKFKDKCSNKECNYAHSIKQLKIREVPSYYKQSNCSNYPGCTYTNGKCNFAHANEVERSYNQCESCSLMYIDNCPVAKICRVDKNGRVCSCI